MAHFWMIDAKGEWGVQKLAGDAAVVLGTRDGAVVNSPAGNPGADGVHILPSGSAGTAWALLAGANTPVRINGQPLLLGIRALRDKDEISVAGFRCFFSTEELAYVTPYPGLAQSACCPRCKQKLEPGEASVACPHCRAYHHQSEKFPCWTYDSSCALCQVQCTDLNAGYQWTPDQL